MPIYSISAPDGNTYEIEGPEGASQQDVIQAVLAQHPEAGNPPKQESGGIPAFTSALQASASESAQGIGNLFGLQGLADWGKRHAQTANQGYKPTTDEDILAAEKQGLGAELGARFRQGREFVGETAGSLLGRYGAPMAAAGAAALAAPEAALAGIGAGTAAFFGTNAAIHSGENVTRQLEQGQDPDRIAAVAAGLGQGVIDQIPLGHLASRVPMLGGLLGKTVGQQAAELAPKVLSGELKAEQATAMLTGTAKNYLRATAENAIAGPLMMTGDEALRRMSAGQDVLSPEAMHEYMQGVKGGIAAAPIFGLMGLGGRGAARDLFRKSEDAFQQKQMGEAQAKDEALRASDEFKLGKLSEYDKAVAQRDQMVADLNAMPALDEHDNFMRQQKANEIGKFVKETVTPLRDEVAQFKGDIGRLRKLNEPPKPVIDESLAKLPAPEQPGLLPAPEKPKVFNEDFMKRGTDAWKENGAKTPEAKQAKEKGSEAPGAAPRVSPISLEDAHASIDQLRDNKDVQRGVIGAFARKLNQSGHIPNNVFKEIARQVRDKENYTKDDLLNEIKFNLPEYTPPEAPARAPGQAPLFTPEEQVKVDRLRQVLEPVLKKFGLGDVKLDFAPQIRQGKNLADAQYHNKVIKVALDTAEGQHLGVLRHESIHALKDMGFFTPQQWKALMNRANSEWIDKYLKKRAVNGAPLRKGEESRFDAYHRETGGNMEAIAEEAIADAFRDHAARGTRGFIGTMIDKIKGFFGSLKNSLNGAGFQTAEDVFGKIERGELKAEANTGPTEAPKPSMKNVPEKEIKQAEEYEKENGIAPYLSGEMDSLPTNMEGPKFSFKKVGKKDTEDAFGLGVPLNANGTVTMYYHTTKDNVVKIANTKKINSDGKSRIYFTNESSGARVFENRGNMDHEIDGSAVLVNIDPRLLQLDMVHPDGRRDFFVAMKEGDYFSRKMTKKIQASSIQHPRDEAITKDGEFSFDKLGQRLKEGADEYRSMTPEQRKKRLAEVRNILKEEHNVGTLLSENGKLEKTRAGEFGVKSEGDSIASMGLGLASAQRISEKTNTCPRRAICEGLCLGDTSGGNKLYGGMPEEDVGSIKKTAFRSGPRMYQYLKTEAMIVHPEEFAFLLQHEIEELKAWSKRDSVRKKNKGTGKMEVLPKDSYQPAVRLNVTSDFEPEVFRGIIEGNKDVKFYDYTKLNSESIGDNHHLTYSSTGASQVVNGEVVPNVESNWRTMRKRLDAGQNVAMAFTSRDHMPKYLIDEETGNKYQVWDGDNYDARFADPKPGEQGNEFGKGMIIGLTNKDATTNRSKDLEATAAKKYNGFFIDYNKARDGDTVTIQDQSKFADAVRAKRDEARQAKAAQPQPVQIVKKPKASLRSVEDTESFKRFFDGSKAVDSEGKPLFLYHGGNYDFLGAKPGKGAFVKGKSAEHGRGAPPDTDVGFFFTPSEGVANAYSQFAHYNSTRKEPLQPIAVYLSIKNPYRATLAEWNAIKDWGNLDTQKYKNRHQSRGAFKALKAKLVAEGYDGVIVGEEGSAKSEYIAFYPEQIKSATHNNGEFDPKKKDIRQSLRGEDPFYSALGRSIDNVTDKPLPAEGWKGWIKSLVNKGEVKQDEVEWSGINDWLGLQQGKVTKAQMQEFFKNNGVKVEEVRYESKAGFTQKMQERLDELENMRDRTDEEDAEFQRLIRAENEASDQNGNTKQTKYADYTLPGGENYREVLLKLPEKEPTFALEDFFDEMEKKYGRDHIYKLVSPNYWVIRDDFESRISKEERATLRKLQKDEIDRKKMVFRTNHWDERDVLAHIRLNDRTDADGNRVLFVEELQSDWGQEGKSKGFKQKPDPRIEEIKKERMEAITKMVSLDSASPEWKAVSEKVVSLNAKLRELGATAMTDTHVQDRVPPGPFVTTTPGWLNLALKRIMKMAADEGYDKVAFINGEQSHQRFPQKHDGGSTLPGFQAFYDNMIPAALNKLMPKFGGGKVGMTRILHKGSVWDHMTFEERVDADVDLSLPDIEALQKQKKQKMVDHASFPITDAMREKTAGGMPLFSLRSSGWSDKRIENLRDTYEYTDGRTFGIAARVNPREFVRATTPNEKYAREIEKEAGELDQSRLEKYSGTPYIQWDAENGVIVGHEGRHRMAALAAAGVESAPVVIQVTDKNGIKRPGMFEPKDLLRLKGQKFFMGKGYEHGKGLNLKDLVPIVYTHKELLKQRYGGEADIKYSLRGDDIVKRMEEVKEKQGYINCKLAVQLATGVSKLENLPKVKKAEVGDIYAFGIHHYAIDIGNNKVVDVPEWGGDVEVKSLKEVTGEYDKPTAIYRPPADAYAPKASLRSVDPNSKEFKQWFERSKVVDESGKPKVMYHGTLADIDDFRLEKSQNRSGNPDGFYFTDSPEDASGYTQKSEYDFKNDKWNTEQKEGGNVMPVYLSIQNPFVVGSHVNAKMVAMMRQELKKQNPNLRDDWVNAKLEIFKEKGMSGDKNFTEIWPSISFDTAAKTRILRAGGFDGFTDGSSHWIAIDPTQVKSAITNTGEFSKTNPSIKASIRSKISALPNGANILRTMDRTTYARPDKSFVERMFDAIAPEAVAAYRSGGFGAVGEVLRASGVNRYQRFATQGEKIAALKGRQTLMADYSAEAAALHSDYAAGVAASALGAGDRMGGIPVYKNGYTKVSNENGTVKGAVAIFAPLAKYNDPKVYQAYQLWAATKRGSRLMADGREHMFTPQELAEGRQLEQAFPEFKTIQRDWIKYNEGLVKYMVDTGVLSKEAGAEFMKYSDYIPFYRQLEGQDTVGPKIFQSMGSVKAPEKLKGGDEPIADFLETIVRNTHAAITSGMKNVAAQRVVRDAVDLGTAQKLNRLPLKGEDFVKVLENGKVEHYAVADPMLVRAMIGLNMPEIPFMRLLSGPANLLRTVVTKMPDFMLANMMRDSMSSYILSGAKVTPIVDTINQFGRNLAGRSKEVEALYNFGILGNHEFSGGVEKTAEQIKKQMRQEAGYKTGAEKALTPVTSIWHALEKGSEASEAATRAAVFKSVLAKTGNEAEAMFQALELMNFKRKGDSPLIRVLAASVPFLNARMQGLDLLYRVGFGKMATQDPAALKRAFLVRGATLMGLTAMYYSMVQDDPVYKNQEQETKDNYWIVPSLGVKIPIPFEVGTIFKTIPERLMALTFGNDTGKDFLSAMGRAMSSTLAMNPIPQGAKPIIETMANYSFFTGNQIVPVNMENLDPRMQKTASTSELAKFLGESTGLSPIKIDHLINGYTGSMGLYLTNLVGSVADANNPVQSPAKNIYEMPVIKRFLVNPEARGTVTDFYKMKKSVDEVVRTSNFLEREGDLSKYSDYIKENMDVYAMKNYIQSLDKNMRELNQLTTMIRANASMTGEQKRDLLSNIQKQQNALTANIQTIKGLMKQ